MYKFLTAIYFILHRLATVCTDDQVQARIVGGIGAKIEDVPYVVLIEYRGSGCPDGRSKNCAGSIINESWVLTAAHCLCVDNYPEEVEIFAGMDDSRKILEAQKRKAIRIVIHDGFVMDKIAKYDFALVKVNKPFMLNKKVQILTLSNDTWPQDQNMYRNPCSTVGWVINVGRSSLTQLRTVDVYARHGQLGCKCWFSFHSRRLICLDDRGSNICRGDSGGTLVCNNKGVGVAHVLYVHEECKAYHFGRDEWACGQTTGAYMFICPFLTWMNKFIPALPITPTSCRGGKLTIEPPLMIILLLFIGVQ